MAGCSSCSSCRPETPAQSIKKAEKLQKEERSGNPRYPHVFIGREAMYSDSSSQAIVTILDDKCTDDCDCFTVKTHCVIKGAGCIPSDTFEITKSAGDSCWKLHALL